jgi:hypothetical protein
MHSLGVWSPTHRLGDKKSNWLKQSSLKKKFEDIQLSNTNKDKVIIIATKLPYMRWIHYNDEFLEELKKRITKEQ